MILMENTQHCQLSDVLIQRVRMSEMRAYLLAHECGLSPSQLSCWLNRITPIREGDPRAQKLAALLNVEQATAFEPWAPARGFAAAGIEFRGRR